MTVYFQFETPKNQEQFEFLLSGKEGIAFTKVIDFVKQRVILLQDRIESEGGTVTVFVYDNGKVEIRYYNGSQEIWDKIQESITQEDYEFIYLEIYFALYPEDRP